MNFNIQSSMIPATDLELKMKRGRRGELRTRSDITLLIKAFVEYLMSPEEYCYAPRLSRINRSSCLVWKPFSQNPVKLER